MIFTANEVRLIRQGRKTAHLVALGEALQPGRLRVLRREVVCQDENGQPIGLVREQVMEPRHDRDQRPVRLTILTVDEVEVSGLSVPVARACGYRTPGGLRDAWQARHPRSPVAQLVCFAVGDVRDRDRFLSWTGRAAGDYTMNRWRSSQPEAAALSEEQLDDLAAHAGQRRAARRLVVAARLGLESPAERLARLEAASDRERAVVRRDLRVISERIARAEKRTAA